MVGDSMGVVEVVSGVVGHVVGHWVQSLALQK